MKISNSEVMRYLGYCGTEPPEQISAQVKELCAVFEANVSPKNVFGIWDCKADSFSVALGDIVIKSENLARHLGKCRRAVLLAATLGQEADTLIRRYTVQGMEKAVIADAVCTAMIEAYCDDIEKEIAQSGELSGLTSVRRFSPGYGDFDIAHQKDFINMLNCGKRIGLTLTSACMLAPAKSITAVIGYKYIEDFVNDTELKGERKRACCSGGECGAADKCEFRENSGK